MALATWRTKWNQLIYTSALLTADGDTGIVEAGTEVGMSSAPGNPLVIPISFRFSGNPVTGDETNTVTIEWYEEANGRGGNYGITTFAEINSSATFTPLELWPGDVTKLDGSVGNMNPMFPFWKITWDVGGAAPAPSHILTLFMSYMYWG